MKQKRTVLFVIFAVVAAVIILLMLSSNQNTAGEAVIKESANGLSTIFDTLKYEKSIDILAKLLLGFGFLMVFVRKHGFSSITATFQLSA